MSIFELRIDVSLNNISNRNTTRTVDPGAYKRRFVILNDIGDPEILVDKKNMRFMYDPGHPDAIKNGAKKGYVEYPNISLTTETKIIINSIKHYNLLASAFQKIDPNFIIEKKSINEIQSILNAIQIEQNERLIRGSYQNYLLLMRYSNDNCQDSQKNKSKTE